MAKRAVRVTMKNMKGGYQRINLFQFFDDGIRKRLPKNIANAYKEQLIENIDNNTFGFELSPRWVDFKRRIGADERPFVMFGHYKNAISIVTDKGHLTVGFKKTTMHPRAKISMGKLAVDLEYGDVAKGIPARPLWRKTTTQFFRTRRGYVSKIIKDTISTKKYL
tara:strand:+ start:29776 stop:30270 length:495 start_codon:yes stop_codon:yes gene_type:complete